MKRTIIKIDEDLCNGCGSCIIGCHEGALQLIDGKARLISELFCDGLGACIGECPVDAIILEEREAEPYDEIKVMERISKNGEKTILAHMNHLKEHNEMGYFKQAADFLYDNNITINYSNLTKKEETKTMSHNHEGGSQCGCPGSKTMDFRAEDAVAETADVKAKSQLRQWPIQMHLVSPNAPYFQNADVLIAADCTAFALGSMHNDLIKGKSIAIACPKLDSDMEIYVDKMKAMVDDAKINTLTVAIMEVPCCGGLLSMAKQAMEKATRKVPIKLLVVGIQGDIQKEMWV